MVVRQGVGASWTPRQIDASRFVSAAGRRLGDEALADARQSSEGPREIIRVVLDDRRRDDATADVEGVVRLIRATEEGLIDRLPRMVAVPDVAYKGRRRPLRSSVRVVMN